MRYLKTFERVWSKNIKVGEIYVIEEILIAEQGYKPNINLGKIIKKEYFLPGLPIIDVETYIKGDLEKYIFYGFETKYIKRLANKEEIAEFESIKNMKKYNL